MSLIADTYANALQTSFKKENDFFMFLEELQLLHKYLKPKEINQFFNSPMVSLEDKKQVLISCLKGFSFKDKISSFLFLLLDKKRWSELNSILTCLINTANKMKGIVLVEIKSAHKIDSNLKDKLIKKLSQFFNKKIALKETYSASNIMGGIKVCSNGLVFDDTLLFHLTQMENQIKRGSYVNTSK